MASSKLKVIAICVVLTIVLSATPRVESPKATHGIVVTDRSAPAAIVWSDDFDDHNISDWGIYGIVGTRPYTAVPGNFTAEDGVLRANGTEDTFSIATVNSSVAYGTWTFDVDVVDTYNHEIVIPFIMIKWTIESWGIDCYFFQIVTGMYESDPQPRLQAGKTYASDSPGGRAVVWFGSFPYDNILGWKNFIITRENDGQFYVYINGTLAMGFKDNQHTTCKEFIFSTGPGPAIDNIVVSDSVDYDAAPPEWKPNPKDQTIEFGQDFRYDINATDHSGIGAWGLNDTTNFVIDSNGVITNIVDLELGRYGLNVSVSDIGGFTRSATFTVSVESATPPDVLLYVMVGGGVVLIVLVVVFIRYRK
jgi:hypothetical protein